MSHGPPNQLSPLNWRFADRPWFRIAGAVVTLVVFAAGVVGTWLAEPEIGPAACIYAACKFFLFHGEHTLLSWEHHRPDRWIALVLLSIAAFGAPILTTGFIALNLGRVADLIRNRRIVRATDHSVILGCGREGIHWAKYLQEKRKSHIVIVNRNNEGPQMGQARDIGAAVLIGDMQDAGVRDRAEVKQSKMVVVCTGNELANIDTARAIEEELRTPTDTKKSSVPSRLISGIRSFFQPRARTEESDGPIILCRVVSQSLLFFMKQSARDTGSRIRYYNIYDFVAKDTIENALEARPGKEAIHLIICGFGRFGQAVLHAAGKNETLFKRLSAVDIVDLRADALLDEYRFSAPEADDRILDTELTSPRQLGILNHELWSELLSKPAGALRLVFICTDNDVTNLVHALAIRRHIHKQEHPPIQATVVMRQLAGPKHKEEGISYATMDHSTDGQIARLIAGPS